MQKGYFKLFLIKIFILLSVIFYYNGCSEDVSPSLYDSSENTSAATPKIISVDPPAVAIGAVTEITITGENFTSDSASIKVYFGKKAGKILSVTPTKLTVISPNISGEMQIKIATNYAVEFSNSYDYILSPAAKDIYPEKKDRSNKPTSVIVDKLENIYSYNSLVGVMKISPDSTSTLYSVKSGETYWTCMRFGAGGVLYGVRGLQAVFSIPDGGGVKNSPWVSLTPNTIKISKIEFDESGNLWAAGKNTSVYKISPDKTIKSFPFDYTVTAMRIYKEGNIFYLYVAAQTDATTKIMRMPLINGEPGAAEIYFDFAAEYGDNYVVNDLTFAEDGTMYLATDLPSPIVYVNPGKSHGLLYNGILLKSPALSLAWGNDSYLYYIRDQIKDEAGTIQYPPTIVKLNLLKKGATYYGY